jgi:hypothetical protein
MKDLDLLSVWLLTFCLSFGIGLCLENDLSARVLGVGLFGASASTLVAAAFKSR